MAGLLSDILGFVDRAKQSAKANVGLLVSDPQEYLASMNDQARQFNQASLLATQADRNAIRGLPVTPEQAAARQYVDQVTQDLAMGFAGTTKLPFGKGIVDEKIGNSTMSYQLGDDGVLKIFSLRTPQSKRGQGSATQAMNQIVQRADEYGIPIKLDASPLDKKTRLDKLVNFYKKFGFEPTGEKVNALGEPVMMRIPK